MSDVIYTAADGKQYKAVPPGPDKNPCAACALWCSGDCSSSVYTLSCITANIIWQPIAIQKSTDNFHQWLQENAEMFRPIYERMKEKE